MLHASSFPLVCCYLQCADGSALLSIALWQTHFDSSSLPAACLIRHKETVINLCFVYVLISFSCLRLPLRTGGWVKEGCPASICHPGDWELDQTVLYNTRYTHRNAHDSLFSLNQDHFLFGRNWMFSVYEKSKETRRGGGEKEDLRRSQTVCMYVYLCVCVCVRVCVCVWERWHRSYLPANSPLNPIQNWPFIGTSCSCRSRANTVMSLTQPRGSTYMVTGAGTARGAVPVTELISG